MGSPAGWSRHVGSSCTAAVCGTMWQFVCRVWGTWGGGRAVPLPLADAASTSPIAHKVPVPWKGKGQRGDPPRLPRGEGRKPPSAGCGAAFTPRGFGVSNGAGAVQS